MVALADRVIATRSGRARAVAYAVAVVLFVVTAVIGFASLPPSTDRARPALFVLVLLLAPLVSVMNAAEYALTARYAGVRVRPVDAIAVAVLSTAANLAPVPGSVLVRAAALRRRGTGYRTAGGVVVAASVAWLSVTAVLGGLALLVLDGGRVVAGAALLTAGIAGISGAHRLAGGHRIDGGRRLTGALLAVEAVTVAVGALRLFLCIRALGYDVDAVQATTLTFASVLASAAGVFPGGLGLREALAAAIGPLVSLPAAVAAAGASIDRLLGLPIVLVASAGFAVARRSDHA